VVTEDIFWDSEVTAQCDLFLTVPNRNILTYISVKLTVVLLLLLLDGQTVFKHIKLRLTRNRLYYSHTISVANKNLITDITIGLPGFNLGRSAWSLLNRFCTGQGRCAPHLHKWHMTSSDKCQCGGVQTMSHIIESCPLTRFDGDLLRLHSAVDCAVTWLQNVAVKAFTK